MQRLLVSVWYYLHHLASFVEDIHFSKERRRPRARILVLLPLTCRLRRLVIII